MNIQFKKGVLEMCVFSLLEDGDRYGYEIAQVFNGVMDIADGTVYPILRRLKQEGYVSSYLMEASGGPPRKYYTLTVHGREFAALLREEWVKFQQQVNQIVMPEQRQVQLARVGASAAEPIRNGGETDDKR